MLKPSGIRILLLWLLIAVTAVCCMAPLPAVAENQNEQFKRYFKTTLEMPQWRSGDIQHIRADQWRMSNDLLVVKGNVYIPYGNSVICADSAMIDTVSHDIEAKGNITLTTVRKSEQSVSIDELERLSQLPGALVEVKGSVIDALGNRKLQVTVYSSGDTVKAERLSGNMQSGILTFTNIQLEVNTFTCKAKRGIRQPGGEFKLEDAEVSSCVYLREGQEHFSVSLDKADVYPHDHNGFGFKNMEKDHTEYSLWGYNAWVRIYGVPVFWLPLLYTPKDESPQFFSSQIGENSRWGFYGLFSKKFDLFEYPDTNVVLDVDWYSLRGVGYGAHSRVNTENSRTFISAYSIYDIRPYESSSDKPYRANSDARLNIPHNRFDFLITNMTHITPRLDFRGQVDWMSDAYMLKDYFRDRADALTEPASYAALEYQGDNFSAALYTRFQVNDFFTTIEKLPEVRLDVPRQEVLPGTGLYYQGSHSADYLRMRWADFDRPLKRAYSKLEDYETGRFDSVNFLYYPLRTDYINIVPRAGIRLTGYSNTSTVKLDENDIFALQAAADPEKDYRIRVKNYNDDGGSKVRFIAEFGVEANTKIYRSWQNIRNAFWGLDGLRHVCEPYINYTYITDPTVNREKLLFFDDVDRLRELNFIRFGLRNRLQTRRGNSLHQWLTMENYWDIYFNEDENFNHIGDFCTKLTFNPTAKLSFKGFFSIDAGNNQTHDAVSYRGRRKAGRPGIKGSLLNRLYLSMQYRPLEDVLLNLSYNYRDGYIGRAAYSMGSTLTEIDTSSSFDQYFVDGRSQTLSFGFSMPVTLDRKTFLAYSLGYDFEEGAFTRQTISLSRKFHCVLVSGMFTLERERDDDDKAETETSFAVYATLTGLEEPINAVRRQAVSKFTGLLGD